MAKKSRRSRRQQNIPVAPSPSDEATSEISPGQSVKRKTIDFVQEYAYVYKDLRNVLIIAVVMFVVLIGLSFVI
jgi:hypothetical protein